MKKVTIKKGHHYSFNWPRLYWNKDVLEFTAVFTDSCLYNIPGDDGFINKLCGLSFGMHHTDSFRIGWRHDSGFIILYAYMYNNGVRISKNLFSIQPPSVYQVDFQIYFDRMFNRILVKGYSGREKTIQYADIFEFDFKGVSKFGYRLNPYFGGAPASPQDITIYLNIK